MSGDPTTFEFFGMPVEVNNLLPANCVLVRTPDEGHLLSFDPEGRSPTVLSIDLTLPQFRTDYKLSPEEIAARDSATGELSAMRLAADLYEAREWRHEKFTEQNPAVTGRRFCMEDLRKIMDDITRKQHESDVKLVEALLACGIRIEVSEHAGSMIAILPARFRDALTEAMSNRDNRDPVENVYRDVLWGNNYRFTESGC